jgi:hypothetical protein
MTKFISSVYSDDPFPHVLIYSTSRTILSLAAVDLISSHILNAGFVSRHVVIAGPAREPRPAMHV